MSTNWFTAKDAPSDEPVRGKTIGDTDWRGLQDRALKANPPMRDMFSPDSIAASKRGAENYRNRHRN